MESEKVQIEFEQEHLYVLRNALEVYSRLRSGQISIALDTVFYDRMLSWDERQDMERYVRSICFPKPPERKYDGQGGYYDQYGNTYGEDGNIDQESEDWKRLKKRPSLPSDNAYYGVHSDEMKEGSAAFDIKKVISQYLHYKTNDGYRDMMNVDGDGCSHPTSGIPAPKVLDFKPEKKFKVPTKFQKQIEKLIELKDFKSTWEAIDLAFKEEPLPRGSSSKIEKIEDKWHVIVSEPIKPK